MDSRLIPPSNELLAYKNTGGCAASSEAVLEDCL